jgi:ubiquitin-conjugating enzyme E2 Q
MIFTESDHSTVDVSSLLERLSSSLANKNIETIIKAVAEKLSAKLELTNDARGDTDSDNVPDLDDYEGLESEYDGDDDDDLHEASFFPTFSKALPNRHIEAAISIRQLKRDLRTAQSAGISVGVYPRRQLRNAEFFSLSLRVMKLGIPEHALEAWGLEDDEYLVLLCRFAPRYPTVSEICDTTFEDWKPQFRFGKCSRPKPSAETSRLAFLTTTNGTRGNREASMSNRISGDEAASGGFTPLYMSNSINMLMNADFLKLLLMRRKDGLSWDGAIQRQKVLAKGGHDALQQKDPSKDDTSDKFVFENSMPSLSHDYALDDAEKLSLPMVAMQFALRRLVRCTKYCMVCHQRLEDEFEALKPYVCSNSLCTYQFVSLGLGANTEHEIIHNPYVVDILISFFASALAHPNSLRQYPTGLNLKTVSTGSKAKPLQHSVAEACFLEKTIRLDPIDYSSRRSIKAGDTILVVIDGVEPSPSTPILNGSK